MYNRYIGNTGKFVRVNDGQPFDKERTHPFRGQMPSAPLPPGPAPPPSNLKNSAPPGGLFGGLGKGLFDGLGKGLFGGSGKSLLGGLGKGINDIFGNLPFGLDVGDILLFLLLLFFFLESGDEEFIIILGIFAISLFKEH